MRRRIPRKTKRDLKAFLANPELRPSRRLASMIRKATVKLLVVEQEADRVKLKVLRPKQSAAPSLPDTPAAQ